MKCRSEEFIVAFLGVVIVNSELVNDSLQHNIENLEAQKKGLNNIKGLNLMPFSQL